MEQKYLESCRSRMINHPEFLWLFDSGIDTLKKLNLGVEGLEPYKNLYSYRGKKIQYLLKSTGIFDAGSIPSRTAGLEFLIDYFYIYHYDL